MAESLVGDPADGPQQPLGSSARRWKLSQPSADGLRSREACRLIGLCLLCASLTAGHGYATPIAVGTLIASVGILACTARMRQAPAPRWLWPVAAAFLAALNLRYVPSPAAVLVVVALAISTGLYALASRPATKVVAGAGALAAVTAILRWHWHWGRATGDVYHLLQGGGRLLVYGHDPYSVLIRSTTPGVRWFHFTYGPATAALAAPAAWLGDARASLLVMFLILFATTAMIARRTGQPAQRRAGIVALMLSLPLTVAMIVTGWTEAFPLATCALWLLLRERHRCLGRVALGIALAAKLTIVPPLIVIGFWSSALRRDLLWASVGAGAVYGAFALWTGPSALAHDLIGVFFSASGSPDSLSANGIFQLELDRSLPGIIGVVAIGGALVWTLRRRPRDGADLFDAAALFSLVAFFFAKWAYFNYYTIPAVMLLLAFACERAETEAPPVPWLSLEPLFPYRM
ncbi:MAG TPA: glycosyltransferase 87 family protein [Verrucomicrobiae bacterium]|nr:glycosyltransferase 87 family protein [Verrucomicrobiae bacterium]